MKFKLLFFFFFISICVFSQSEIYYFKDTSNSLTLEEVSNNEFTLLEEQVLETYSNASHWFKIPAYPTDSEYIFRILYERINKANVYQNSQSIEKLAHQRFLSYQFSRKYDVFVKVTPKLHSYIPIDFEVKEESIKKEQNFLLFNGFYYGFAFLVIIYNLFYYLLFKDDAFLYYSLFLSSLVFGVFIMDGMLNFFDLSDKMKNILMISNYIFLAFFSSKFTNSYLFLEMYYPKLKRFSYAIGVFIVFLGGIYLIIENYYYLLLINILVFSLLIIYWICSLLLFNKNFYTKILVFAYVILLFSGIDFFILKFLGVSLIDINATTIKIGSYIEMIVLSIGVIYRMNTLKHENKLMRNEIITYSRQLSNLEESQHQDEKSNINNLSYRERQIFNLIVSGKTNKEIALELNISINTVKFHLKNVYDKLNIKSRKEALTFNVI